MVGHCTGGPVAEVALANARTAVQQTSDALGQGVSPEIQELVSSTLQWVQVVIDSGGTLDVNSTDYADGAAGPTGGNSTMSLVAMAANSTAEAAKLAVSFALGMIFATIGPSLAKYQAFAYWIHGKNLVPSNQQCHHSVNFSTLQGSNIFDIYFCVFRPGICSCSSAGPVCAPGGIIPLISGPSPCARA